MRPATIKYLHSAGGVIFREDPAGLEVALISTKQGAVWTLPKGLLGKNETPEMTAVREIREETGLTGELLTRLGEKSYWFYLKDENAKCKKTVAYFLLRYLSGDTTDSCWEVDEARWFPLDEAMGKLSYRSDRDILQKAKEQIAALHPATEE